MGNQEFLNQVLLSKFQKDILWGGLSNQVAETEIYLINRLLSASAFEQFSKSCAELKSKIFNSTGGNLKKN